MRPRIPPRIGLTLSLDDAFHASATPLVADGLVDALARDVDPPRATPRWAAPLLDRYAELDALYAHGARPSFAPDRRYRAVSMRIDKLDLTETFVIDRGSIGLEAGEPSARLASLADELDAFLVIDLHELAQRPEPLARLAAFPLARVRELRVSMAAWPLVRAALASCPALEAIFVDARARRSLRADLARLRAEIDVAFADEDATCAGSTGWSTG